MSADILEQAFDSTARVLANVKPDSYDQPTPCASWTIRDLVNHIVGGASFFAVVAETGAAPTGGQAPDFTEGDINDAFDQGTHRALAAFRAEGAMEKAMTLPFGTLPGSIFVWIAAIDTFTHGWDLAKATGQSTDLDPKLAEQLLGTARVSLSDSLRGPDGEAPFGPRVDVPDTAPMADQLAGFMGRQP